MNRQLTPESAMKTTIRSGFLPKIPIKSSAKLDQMVFSSLDNEKLQKKTKNFDFSNLGRTVQTSYNKSRVKQRTLLQPLTETLNQKITTKQQLGRVTMNLIKSMQIDGELQMASKYLYINASKLSQLLLMLAPPGIEVETGFYTVQKKTRSRINYLIELDRFLFSIQYLSIPVPQQHLMALASLSDSLSIDEDFGMIINFQQLFTILQQAIQQMKQPLQQELSTTTASDDEDRMSPSSKIIQRVLSRQQTRKVQFKVKKLGYLNETNVVAYYDSFADLKKRVGREWNVKNYVFGAVRFGYINLEKYPQFHDQQSKHELRIFGHSRKQLPIFIQIIYKHKSQQQHMEIALNKIYLYQNKTMPTLESENDFKQLALYLNGYGLSNQFQTLNQECQQQIHESQQLNSEDICLKGMFTEIEEQIMAKYCFDQEQKQEIKGKEYKPTNIEIVDQSDSDSDNDIYEPLFVKSIQSYPQYLIDLQQQYAYTQIYRYFYQRMFNTPKILKDDSINFKIKPEHQFTENFVNVPSVDSCSYQRHKHKNPETLDETDEEDNLLYEQPLEALDKQDLSVTFQYQPLNRSDPEYDVTQYMESQSSVIIQDEQKVNDKLQFAHNLSPFQIALQDCYAFILRKRYPMHINMQVIPFEVSKSIPIKEISFEASTVIIDNTLTFDPVLKDLDSAPMMTADSDEEPSFDEEPMEIDLPEANEQHSVQENVEDEDEFTLEKVTETVDLKIQECFEVDVKKEFVSKLILDQYPIYLHLDEKLRMTQPETHKTTMEGKEIQSLQISVETKGSRIYLKSFAIKALCDQRISANIEKKPNLEEEEQTVNIYEDLYLSENWNQGQFCIHLFYSPKLEQSVQWLKTTLTSYFPQIIVLEDSNEGFDAYIYGVGPVNKRDGSNRTLLFKKDIEDWDQFEREFKYRSLQIYDTLCCLISLYGSVNNLETAQNKFIHENFSRHTKSRIDKIHMHPYKYVENIERERNRPTTGYRSIGKRQ